MIGKPQFSHFFGSRASFRVASWFEPAILDASWRVDEFEPNSDPALLAELFSKVRESTRERQGDRQPPQLGPEPQREGVSIDDSGGEN